ncbi:MAG TPA: hypothetical protein PKE06_13300 [Flavilitoribacter sp.]|nr:hypothetical protein [Flavilitoribacter sp.]HMQ90103.1 hypothetical protein [Flavilitoribacter sp.]
MIFRFFKVPKHKSFDFKPRFYDPEKEEQDIKASRADRIRSGGADGAKARIKGGFRRSFNEESSYRKEQMRRANIRLFMIIAVLLVLTYFLLKVNLPGLMQLLGSDKGAS